MESSSNLKIPFCCIATEVNRDLDETMSRESTEARAGPQILIQSLDDRRVRLGLARFQSASMAWKVAFLCGGDPLASGTYRYVVRKATRYNDLELYLVGNDARNDTRLLQRFQLPAGSEMVATNDLLELRTADAIIFTRPCRLIPEEFQGPAQKDLPINLAPPALL
jgi:hypothetical protein